MLARFLTCGDILNPCCVKHSKKTLKNHHKFLFEVSVKKVNQQGEMTKVTVNILVVPELGFCSFICNGDQNDYMA
jgi:hypothetical protein